MSVINRHFESVLFFHMETLKMSHGIIQLVLQAKEEDGIPQSLVGKVAYLWAFTSRTLQYLPECWFLNEGMEDSIVYSVEKGVGPIIMIKLSLDYTAVFSFQCP